MNQKRLIETDDFLPKEEATEAFGEVNAVQKSTVRSADDDCLQAFLKEIGKHKLLTAIEEIELSRLARGGDKAARTRLIQSNLRLVVNIAKRYCNHGIAFADLIQEATFGLMRAVDKFDPERGFRFSTYAVWWVRQAVTRALAEKSRLIRIPVNLVEAQNKMRKSVKLLCGQLGRLPTIDEIAAESGLAKEKVVQAMHADKELISLDMSVGEDCDGALGDLIADDSDERPEEQATRGLMARDVLQMVGQLQPSEQAVLRVRFGLDGEQPRSLEQSGQILGFSRERIRQIENKALKKLRKSGRAEPMREYLA